MWRACVGLGSCALLSGAVLCWVLLCSAVVCCCVLCWLSFSFTFFFCVVPCLSVVLRSVSACVAPLVWCCVGVPASLLSVRCFPAPLALAGVVRCCLLCLGVCCWAWLSSAVSVWLLVSCFRGAVPDWPRGLPPCGLLWCVFGLRCAVLCPVVLCRRVVVCCHALLVVCVVACACCLFPAAALSTVCVLGCRAVSSLSSPHCLVLCCAVLVPWRCAVRVVCPVPGVSCCWCLVSLPVFGGPLAGLVASRYRLVLFVGVGVRVWPRGPPLGVLVWFPVMSCSPVLCLVVLCLRVVLCCGALSSFLPYWWRLSSVSLYKSPVKPVKMVYDF